jgi:hypothetical protein
MQPNHPVLIEEARLSTKLMEVYMIVQNSREITPSDATASCSHVPTPSTWRHFARNLKATLCRFSSTFLV